MALRVRNALLISLFICTTSVSWADSWVLPSVEAYSSSNNLFRLTVTPRDLEDQLAYFEDEERGVAKPGQQAGGQLKATARLERRGPGNTWTEVWTRPLINDVAPTYALVSPDGRHVVTFDDWHSIGTGANVVAIYDLRGRHLRSFRLSDLLTTDHIKSLPHSVSSVDWHEDSRIDAKGRWLELGIVAPTTAEVSRPHSDANASWGCAAPKLPDQLPLRVELATGKVDRPDSELWEAANTRAATIAASIRKAEAQLPGKRDSL